MKGFHAYDVDFFNVFGKLRGGRGCAETIAVSKLHIEINRSQRLV